MTILNNDEARAFFVDNGFPEQYNDGMTAYLRQLLGKDLSLPDLLRDYVTTYGTTEFTPLTPPTKSYNFLTGSLDADFTFSRATTGYYYDNTGTLVSAAINTPRFDYNPTTLELKGLLVEDAATNLCIQSQALNSVSWSKANSSVVADATTAPDGTLTADELIENAAAGSHGASIANVATLIPVGTIYTQSVYVKAGVGTRRCQFIFAGNAYVGLYTNFNFQTETLVLGTGISSGRVDKCPNGWYRITISAATIVDLQPYTLLVRLCDTNQASNRSYTGDGTSSIYVWGAQAELGTFGTSYIPTAGATASRSADSLSITGLTFSGFWNASEGTFRLKGINDGGSSGDYININDTTTNEKFLISRETATDVLFRITDGGIDVLDETLVGSSNFTDFGIAMGYKLDNCIPAINNTLGTLDTSCTLPTVTQLTIGGLIPIWVKDFTYYNVRMSDSFVRSLSRV